MRVDQAWSGEAPPSLCLCHLFGDGGPARRLLLFAYATSSETLTLFSSSVLHMSPRVLFDAKHVVFLPHTFRMVVPTKRAVRGRYGTHNYTPGSGEHGPRFLTGGPGAAPGGVASKNGLVYMRVQGDSIPNRLFCV